MIAPAPVHSGKIQSRTLGGRPLSRDARVVRLRRIPRALHLAGHRALPQYFEIDDTTVPH